MTVPALVVAPDAETLAALAAARVDALARDAVERRGVFRIALSGGETPRRLHARLASDPAHRSLPWDQTDVFWGDERHVGPEHAESNYRMARETLLDHVPLRPDRIFRIRAEEPDAEIAARDYERTLTAVFGLTSDALPRFDVMIMGIGPDGHTASLFPKNPALTESVRLVVAPWVSVFETFRITMTLPVINAAAHVIFVVAGEEKAAATAAAIDPPDDVEPPPAALVQPIDGTLLWMLDEAAARFIQAPRPEAQRD